MTLQKKTANKKNGKNLNFKINGKKNGKKNGKSRYDKIAQLNQGKLFGPRICNLKFVVLVTHQQSHALASRLQICRLKNIITAFQIMLKLPCACVALKQLKKKKKSLMSNLKFGQCCLIVQTSVHNDQLPAHFYKLGS